MKGGTLYHQGIFPGGIAGLLGGALFGAALVRLGGLGMITSLAGTESAAAGLALHMLVAAILGAGFGALVRHQGPSTGGTFFWGLTYGTFWWFLGPLTLMPLVLGEGLDWSVSAAQRAFPSLLGHWVYGAGTALALVGLRAEHRSRGRCFNAGVVSRGALAGLASGWLLVAMLASQPLPGETAGGPGALAVFPATVLCGLGFAMLYPVPDGTAGASLVRGTAYGFFCWIAVERTILPLLRSGEPGWSLAQTRSGFPAFPAYVLFGAALALSYKWLHQTTCLLFSDVVHAPVHQGIGARALRAVGRGTLAGMTGGLVFTLVMLQVGFLPAVARLVGSSSALTGFAIHLFIANVVGVSYALLFRNQSHDAGSAIGWGTSYGLFWWFLGPLTLMPILLGTTPRWTVAVMAGMLDSLVGHLAYGAALGLTFHGLEARYSPWWIPHRKTEAERVRRRQEMVRTSAPALWTLMVLIALILPVILSE